MPIREAEILWEGPLSHGTGTLSSGSGALEQLAVTWAARMGEPDGKTSPEELIAAAHTSCFAMALAFVLDDDRAPPERLIVRATCALSSASGAPRITKLQLTFVHGYPASTRPGLRTASGVRATSAQCQTRCAEMSRSACNTSSRSRANTHRYVPSRYPTAVDSASSLRWRALGVRPSTGTAG